MVSIPQAVSTVATFFVFGIRNAEGEVSIPQAVSTVATKEAGFIYSENCFVSIPQAVSTVATRSKLPQPRVVLQSFNTASGKYCCNSRV